MPGPVEHRSSTRIIKYIRDFARGRINAVSLRFPDEQSKRTQPPPNLPGGPYHKTSEIYYYTHDARREVKPPLVISSMKQIGTKSVPSEENKYITPGKIYKWD